MNDEIKKLEAVSLCKEKEYELLNGLEGSKYWSLKNMF